MRRSGRTTKLVDQLVQDLFNTGEAIATDHWWDGQTGQIMIDNKHILRVFVSRLYNEHSHHEFHVNKSTCTVKLIK